MANEENSDWFQQQDAPVQQLREMARGLNDGSVLPTTEHFKKLQALTGEAEQARPRPTKAEKERFLASLRQEHGDLPREMLILREVWAKLKGLRGFSQEMQRALKLDLSGPIIVGDVAQVRRLIAQGADVNKSCAAGYRLLMLAGLQKQWEIVELLRNAGAEAGLHEAAMLGDTEILRRLIDSGVEIDAKSKSNGFTALHWAAGLGRTEAVRLLLAHGANVDNVSEKGFTPLLSASSQKHPEVVALLREHGAFVGIVEAAMLGDSALVLRKLEEGTDIHSENAACMDPLMAAAACGQSDVMRLLLAWGADPHKTNARHISVLIWAISNDRREAVNLLLDSGVDVNAPDQQENAYLRGRTPISHAITRRSAEMTRLLIERGADVSVRDLSGLTPLHWVAAKCDPHVMRVLLDAGADVNASGRRKYTPLMRVVANTLIKTEIHRSCVRLLLDRGADVNARAEHGKTALMMAAAQGHRELVAMLIEAGAEIDATDEYGATALAAAGHDGHAEVVALLKSYGAKVNLFENLSVALLSGRDNVLKALLVPRLRRRRYTHS